MRILGISCYFHDAAAALLADGQLVAAAEEERFSRIKHDFGFPSRAIRFCLDRGRVSGADLDYVAFFEKPFIKFERILQTAIATVPRSHAVFRKAMTAWMLDKLWVKSRIRDNLGISPDRILFVEHHQSHAASAFFCSPFDRAAILTVDGVGEWATATMGRGNGTSLALDAEIRFPHSLGLLYSAFTAFLGFEVNEGEYKVMGMAPYGVPRYQDKVWKLIDSGSDGAFALNLDYFSFHYSAARTYNSRFGDLFGKPRSPDTPFFTEIGLTAADAVVDHVSADLARLMPSYEPIVSMAVLISVVVTALILASLWLKTCAARRRVLGQQETRVSGLSPQHGTVAPPVSWKRTRESA